MRKAIAFVSCLILNFNIFSQGSCGVQPSNIQGFEDCYDPASGSYTIPIYFHEVFYSQNSSANVPNNYIDILDDINTEFNNFGLKVQFVLANFNEDGNCFNINKGYENYDIQNSSINYTDWDDELSRIINDEEKKDYLEEHYLNIWVVSSVGEPIPELAAWDEVAGYSLFPPSIQGDGQKAHVFITNDYFNKKVLCHELGHLFGLYHTFKGGCNATNNCLDGDFIVSTSSCQQIIKNEGQECTNLKICGSNADYQTDNFMSYIWACMDKFYEEQYRRIAVYAPEYSFLTSSDNLDITMNDTPAGALNNSHTFITNQNAETFYTKTNSHIYVDGNITFNMCNFYLAPSTKFIIKSGSNVVIDNCKFKTQNCSTLLWDGIIVEEGATLKFSSGSLVENAYIGILAKNNSSLDLSDLNINNCYVGIALNGFGKDAAVSNANISILNFFKVYINGSNNINSHTKYNTTGGSGLPFHSGHKDKLSS